MSKVVKKVGKAIGKVVKGVVKGVKKVVKKIAKSKVFRVIATAALVYFGGAALMGGFSSLSAGGSFLQGMGTGISNAWSGVTGAFSSATSGATGGFSKAGAQLAAGAKGQAINTTTGAITGAGGQVVGTSQAFAPAVTGGIPTNVAASGAGAGGVNATGINTTALNTPLSNAQGFTSPLSNVPGQTNFVGQAAQSGANVNAALGQAGMAPVAGQVTVPGAVPAGGGFTTGASNATLNQMYINSAQNTLANTAGLSSSLANTAPQAAGFFSDPLVKYGAMTVGGGLLSGYAQGRAAENIERQRREDEAAALLAYNENVGTVIGMPVYNPATGQYEYSNQANAGG